MSKTEITKFKGDLQSFLDDRQAAIFFGDQHGEIWQDGVRIGAITHQEDDARLEFFHCDC